MDKRAREELDRLLGRLADGDRGAFDPVFARAHPVVLRFVRGALASSAGADADDVAQSALLKVFARAQRYDPARDALSWILGIAAFEVKTHRKRIVRRRETSEEVLLQEARDPLQLEDEAIARELARSLTELLGTMSPADEEAILAAAELRPRPEVSPAAFRKRLERALGRLRHAWRERHGVD